MDPRDFRARAAAHAEEEHRRKRQLEQQNEDLLWLMSDERGRRVAALLLEEAAVRDSSFDTNALKMAFNEGFRNYGRMLEDRLLGLFPEAYLQMLKEQKNGR